MDRRGLSSAGKGIVTSGFGGADAMRDPMLRAGDFERDKELTKGRRRKDTCEVSHLYRGLYAAHWFGGSREWPSENFPRDTGT